MQSLFKNKTELTGIIICLISAMISGLYPPAARAVYLDGGNITFVVLATTFFRMVGFCIFASIKNEKIFQNLEECKTSIYAGFLQALSIIGILGGAYFLPGAVVVIIMFTYSLMLLLFSAWRGEMKLNLSNSLSTIAALLGLALVLNISENNTSYPIVGVLLSFMAAFATFGRIYIFGQQSKSRHPFVTGSEAFIVAFGVLSLLIFWDTPQLPETSFGIIMIIATSLSLAISSFGMFYGIAYLGPYKFSMIMKLEPVFTTLFGIILISDVLNTGQYIGIAIIVISLISLQVFDKQKQND